MTEVLCFRTMTRLYYGWTQLELIITETEDLCILHITILCWLEKLTREHITIFNIWTHKKFEIISEGRRKLQLGESIAFSYEVIWKKSDTKFEVWTAFFEAKLIKVDLFYRIDLTSTLTQTFSNIRFMMVIFLVGLVTMILMRSLRKVYARYSEEGR